MTKAYATCIVVPTYNEVENVIALVEEVRKAKTPDTALLFVDDSSPDGTGKAISALAEKEQWIKLLTRSGKMGIGSAYQDGFREAISTLDAEVIVEMDGDLQHPPSALPALIRALENGADVAVGSRYVAGGGVSGWSFARRAVSRTANAYVRAVLGLSVKDATSGFRAYTRAAAARVSEASLPAKGFEFQVASLKALKTGMKIEEVPYTFSARSAGKSKLGMGDMARFFVAVMRLAF